MKIIIEKTDATINGIKTSGFTTKSKNCTGGDGEEYGGGNGFVSNTTISDLK